MENSENSLAYNNHPRNLVGSLDFGKCYVNIIRVKSLQETTWSQIGLRRFAGVCSQIMKRHK